MIRTGFIGAAIAVAFVGWMGAGAAQASTVTEYADLSQGASFVSATSINGAVFTSGQANAVQKMQDDILTDTPVKWFDNGDTRYIFTGSDTTSMLEIDLGQVRQVNTIGASFGIPPSDDRYVVGPFSIKVSTDNLTFTDWGTVNAPSSNTTLISLATAGVRYIQYFFGAPGTDHNSNDGVAVWRVNAQNVAQTPIPGSVLLFLTGLGVTGLMARRRAAGGSAA